MTPNVDISDRLKSEEEETGKGRESRKNMTFLNLCKDGNKRADNRKVYTRKRSISTSFLPDFPLINSKPKECLSITASILNLDQYIEQLKVEQRSSEQLNIKRRSSTHQKIKPVSYSGDILPPIISENEKSENEVSLEIENSFNDLENESNTELADIQVAKTYSNLCTKYCKCQYLNKKKEIIKNGRRKKQKMNYQNEKKMAKYYEEDSPCNSVYFCSN